MNRGDFINEGTYNVKFTSGGSCGGISNEDNITNTGEIIIDATEGLVNGSLVVNNGVNASFENRGSLDLNNIGGGGFGYGIYNYNGAIFKNFSSIATSGITNQNTKSIFINHSSINSAFGIVNTGRFENKSGAVLTLQQIVENRAVSLLNGPSSSSFDDDEIGNFLNEGEISIRGNTAFTFGSYGIQAKNGSVFLNDGNIEVQDIYFGGFSSFTSQDSLPSFINNGTFTIDGVAGQGIDNSEKIFDPFFTTILMKY